MTLPYSTLDYPNIVAALVTAATVMVIRPTQRVMDRYDLLPLALNRQAIDLAGDVLIISIIVEIWRAFRIWMGM